VYLVLGFLVLYLGFKALGVDGLMVGTSVGSKDGIKVGALDGSMVGSTVGASDGVTVGACEGSRVGTSDGAAEGTRDGFLEVAIVDTTVGGAVTPAGYEMWKRSPVYAALATGSVKMLM